MALSLTVFSQEKKAREAAAAASAAVDDYMDISESASTSIDTLNILSGKPYVFLINIAEYPVQIMGDELISERNELENNFKNENLEVILVEHHSFLQLEDGRGLDMTNLEFSYVSAAFWSGNLEDEIELFDKIINTTEFVSSQMGLDKKSSYTLNAINYKNEVEALLKKNYITENSKIVMDKFLQNYNTPILGDNEEFWLVQDITSIKNMKVLIVEKGKEKTYKDYEFNSDGQLAVKTNYTREGKKSESRKFIYKNKMLTEIQADDRTTTVNYDDKKMIFSENIGAADETTIVFIEDDMLLSKRYLLMVDDEYAKQNLLMEDKIAENCVIRYTNGNILYKNCSTPYGSFPFTHTYTSYQSATEGEGVEFMQQIKYRIDKKTDKIYEKYYSDAENENEKDSYELNQTYYLNENNLLEKISLKEGITIKIVYTYFQ